MTTAIRKTFINSTLAAVLAFTATIGAVVAQPTDASAAGKPCVKRVLKKGDKGTCVKRLQKVLNWQTGSKVAADGTFGEKTKSMVKKFQKKGFPKKVKVDGVVGKSTWSNICYVGGPIEASKRKLLDQLGCKNKTKVYKWNNTHVTEGKVKVQFCTGKNKVETLKPGTKTGRDVCKIWVPNGMATRAKVKETGTVLFDGKKANCGNGKWVTLTSKTDSNRTVEVFQKYKGEQCV